MCMCGRGRPSCVLGWTARESCGCQGWLAMLRLVEWSYLSGGTHLRKWSKTRCMCRCCPGCHPGEQYLSGESLIRREQGLCWSKLSQWIKLWWRALVVFTDHKLAVWYYFSWRNSSNGTGYELPCVLSCLDMKEGGWFLAHHEKRFYQESGE